MDKAIVVFLGLSFHMAGLMATAYVDNPRKYLLPEAILSAIVVVVIVGHIWLLEERAG